MNESPRIFNLFMNAKLQLAIVHNINRPLQMCYGFMVQM
jgi:hypothetical protein